MLKVLLSIAALIAVFTATALNVTAAHAAAASVASEIAAIRAHLDNLGPTEDLSTVPLSPAYGHTVIIEGERWAVVSRDPQGGIWISTDASEPVLLGVLLSPLPAGSEVTAAHGFASNRLAPTINDFIEQNVASDIEPDALGIFLEEIHDFESRIGITAIRESIIPTPAAEVAA
jgi:hypothetical protein